MQPAGEGAAGAGMEDGVAGPGLGAVAPAAGMRARPFAPFCAGVAEADEGGGDWSFIDCEMEEVDLQDLPSATIACHLDPRVFVDGLCRVRTPVAERGPRPPPPGRPLPPCLRAPGPRRWRRAPLELPGHLPRPPGPHGWGRGPP